MATTTTTIYYDDEVEESEGLIVYPDEDYESWVSLEDAETYFEGRLNADHWLRLDSLDQEAALRTAFRSLSELTLDLTDLEITDRQAALLKALGQAQCEQALYELVRDLDGQQAESVSLGGLLSAKFPERKKTERYSERALAILRHYLSVPSVKRFR
jgi:hypothetical protein